MFLRSQIRNHIRPHIAMKALICTDRADLTLTVNLTLNLNAAKISFAISKIETKLKNTYYSYDSR